MEAVKVNGPEFTKMLDLASVQFGAKALKCSDDFFAPMSNLLKVEPAVFIAGKFTVRGKWMDGWESRRKRGVDNKSHDWCVVRLGAAGQIFGVNIDTAHFTGNFPESASLEAGTAAVNGSPNGSGAALPKTWVEILPRSALKGGSANYFEISDRGRFTHVRLKIFPDGGVARLRVYGEVQPLWEEIIPRIKKTEKFDLAAAVNGARVVDCNDNYFGPKDNLIMPGRAKTMGEGWETKRKRGIDDQSHDWILVRLGHAGHIQEIEIDTNHFKGNYPDSALLEGCDEDGKWYEILSRVKLKAHHQHRYKKELKNLDHTFVDVRLKIFPDGGISRLRVLGRPS